MDLSLRQHKPAEFAPHGQARWFSHCCRVGHASGTLPPPRHAARAARGSGTSSSGRKQLSKRFLHGETPGAIYKGNNLHVRGSNVTFKVHLVFHKGSAIPEVLTSEVSNQQPARARVSCVMHHTPSGQGHVCQGLHAIPTAPRRLFCSEGLHSPVGVLTRGRKHPEFQVPRGRGYARSTPQTRKGEKTRRPEVRA